MSDPIYRASIVGQKGEARLSCRSPAGAALMLLADMVDQGATVLDALIDVKPPPNMHAIGARFEAKLDLRAGRYVKVTQL